MACSRRPRSRIVNVSCEWCNGRMDPSTAPSCRGYRFPCEIIACVGTYFRFSLSFRDHPGADA
jgi:hypothetical protein